MTKKEDSMHKPDDWEKIGLKCGIEIHQQLKGKKLFCRCPAEIIDEKTNLPDIKVKRRLRAVTGETGKIDSAAAHEEGRAKEFVYDYYKGSCCLVELDEEPPHPINNDAVRTAYIVAKLLNARPVDEVQVMRKTVVDGSNTSGFQRTSLIAMHGWINTAEGKVSIPTICLEEDAAKIVERKADIDEYNLSRLGIPLVEIATGPDIRTPKGVKETAEKLGFILRSVDGMKRGLGTIRQDVNVSIRDGARVEIKGAQDLKMLTKLVENEAKRQLALLKLKEKIKKSTIKKTPTELTDIFKSSDSKVIMSALSKKGSVFGLKLNNFSGYLGTELQPNKRLGTELSDYAKTKAGVGGIFHSDELPKYGITGSDVKKIREMLDCKKDDAFIIVADSADKAKRAVVAASERAEMVFCGIPSEVRKANHDGTTNYMRPMPGGARMYPETDVLPLKMDFGKVALPKLIDDKASEYEKTLKLGPDLAKAISRSERDQLFEQMAKALKSIKPAFIAETLISYEKEIRNNRKDSRPEMITDKDLESVFCALDKGEISKASVIDALSDVACGKKLQLDRYRTISYTELESLVEDIIKKNKGAPFGALMGEVMKRFKGRVDGRTVSDILKKNM
ncbi:Glu-tRNA(Gln) amidotransferase subunit GatE [Candidatus Woesearchaeota archaeon]|nr:Glu-tRNA(Gln) amidotransferase subunit GatE [Candidatus Woesearchaeota archaeon]